MTTTPASGAATVTDSMVLAALQVQYPAAYGPQLRHPANGPKTAARTEGEIDIARRMISAALASAPAQPAAEPAKPIGYLNPKVLGPDGKIDAPGALTYSSRPCGGWTFPIYAAAPAQAAVGAPLLDYAMQIAHERELRVTGNHHDEDGAKLRFEAAATRHTAMGAAQPDSVLEDAARYRFLRDGEWRDTDLEPFIRLQLNTLWDAKIDAARKQGEKQ